MIRNRALSSLIQYLGKKSLVIYCMSGTISGCFVHQMPILSEVSRVYENLHIINLLETAAVIVIIVITLHPLEKSQLFRTYFMGGR